MPQYEFTADQNSLIGSLGSKMKGVGAFFIIVGVLHLLVTGLIIAAIYRNNLPPDVMANVPAEVKAKLETLPPQHHLWGFAANAGISSLLYLCLGGWTRGAGASFRKISATENNDISHLMNGLGSLNSMYGLIYTLLVFFMLAVVAAIGLGLYGQWQLMQGGA